MPSKNDFQKAIDLLENSSRVLITTHTRPDGDACGCVAAMEQYLAVPGKSVQTLFLSPVPPWYGFLFAREPGVLGHDLDLKSLAAGQPFDPDLVVIVDTNSRRQLPEFEKYIEAAGKPVLVIDHHASSDGLGTVELADSTAAAAGVLVHELFMHAGRALTQSTAEALFVAVAVDTGWFRFENTDARALRCAAELVAAGVRPPSVYHRLHENFSPQRFALMTTMLAGMQLYFDNRFAVQQLTRADFTRTGASYADTENLVDECRRISSVQVVTLLVEMPDGRIRCSFRSSGAVDVRAIAEHFGGGGHAMAAGSFVPGSLKKAMSLVLDAVGATLGVSGDQAGPRREK